MYKVGVIGVTGYAGGELVKCLEVHPQVELTYVGSEGSKGSKLGDYYPFYNGSQMGELIMGGIRPEEASVIPDIVLSALPHGLSIEVVAEWVAQGCRVIDLSADYRLKDPKVYKHWYQKDHTELELLQEAAYGLCEINRDHIQGAKLVANPGCFPTGALLSLYPLLEAGIIAPSDMIIDAKTGVSGGGKTPKQVFHYPERTENFQAYSVASHRHTPEIEEQLSYTGSEGVTLLFTPHLVPMSRGIFSTIYVDFSKSHGGNVTEAQLHEFYQEYYQEKPFVLPTREVPQTKWVAGSNAAMIGAKICPRTGKGVLMSAIDNLMKGAGGQAVQNMNIMLGLNEAMGLPKRPTWP